MLPLTILIPTMLTAFLFTKLVDQTDFPEKNTSDQEDETFEKPIYTSPNGSVLHKRNKLR